jgi:hypothetical protein
MNTLSVSSYSFREQLGPVKFDVVDPAGNAVHIDLPFPRLLELADFPRRARDAFGVDAIRRCQASGGHRRTEAVDRTLRRHGLLVREGQLGIAVQPPRRR